MLAVLSAACLLVQATLPGPRQQDEQPNPASIRSVYTLHRVVDVDAGGKAAKALKVYQTWLQKAGASADLPVETMVEMYEQAGGDHDAFKRIAFLIQDGLDGHKIQPKHSVDMATIRERWIEDLILEIGHDHHLRVARSDSGNTASGMKSDLDQTFFIWEWSPETQSWRRAPERDKFFIEEFRRRWEKRYPLSLEAVDVASIEGRNRFPDPRDVAVTDYWHEYERTLTELRLTPGAYKLQGAVLQQMQFRALAEILKGNVRAFQVYEPGPDGKTWAKKIDLDPDDAAHTLFGEGIEPELMPGSAFGAALANFIELQHYLHAEKFETKYHLRTWEDSALVLYLSEHGLGKEYKVEYAALPPEKREAYNWELLQRIFPGDGELARKARERHSIALEISNDLRLLHKNQSSRTQVQIFEPLAREMHGEAYTGSPEQLAAAVAEHRRLAAEFCLESVYHSSTEAFQLLLDPHASTHALDPDRYRHLLVGVPEEKWGEFRKRMGEGAQLSFLYGFYALGEEKGRELVRRLSTKFPEERLRLADLWHRSRWMGIESFARHPLLHLEACRTILAAKAPELARRVQRQIMADMGFEHVEQAELVGRMLAEKQLSWNPRTFGKNMFLDPGNVGALANIVRTYVESKGNMDSVLATTVDELVLSVPVGGQLVAATRGGIEGAVLMAGAIQFPVAGLGLLAYSVGEAGYAVYDIEFVRPAAGNLEDAVYRGFLGPATRSYGGEPPAFTDADMAELQRWSAEMREIRVAGSTPFLPISGSPEAARDLARLRGESDAAQERLHTVIEPRIAALEEKQREWEEFRDESWAGGYFTEGGAQKTQKPFRHALLAPVQPIISFSAGGIVDFRASYDAQHDDRRIAELEARIAAEQDAAARLRMQAECYELDLQRSRARRAQAYLAFARTGRYPSQGPGPDSESDTNISEAGIGSPELMQKLRRDSLYPWFLEHWAAASRVPTESFVPSTDRFVDEFFAKYGAEVVRECVDLGLLQSVSYPTGDSPAAQYAEHLPEFPAESIAALKRRLSEDFERSKGLWEEYKRHESQRKAKDVIALGNRNERYNAEAAGLSSDQLFDDPGYQALLSAMRWENVRRSTPRIESTVYRVPSKEAKLADGANQGLKPCFVGEVTVHADPTLYLPPYTAQVCILDGDGARKALSSGAIQNEPLLPETCGVLERALREQKRDLDRGGYFALTRVFASGMPDLSSAPASTIRGLPGVDPSPSKARPRKASFATSDRGVLMGESVSLGRIEPEISTPHPPAATATVAPLRLAKLSLSRTWSRITEGRNGYGSLRRSTTTTGDSAEMTSPLAQGACSLPDAKVDFALTLDVPQQIAAEKEFRLGAKLRYGVASQKGEVRVHLVLDGVAQETTLASGSGELEVACRFPFEGFYPKPTEWNFMHDRTIVSGMQEDRSTSGRRALHYQIRHDAPSFDGLEAAPERPGEHAVSGGVPHFIYATTNGFHVRAEALRGDEVLLKLTVDVEHTLDGGVKLTVAPGSGEVSPSTEGRGGADTVSGNPGGGSTPIGGASSSSGSSGTGASSAGAGMPTPTNDPPSRVAGDPAGVLSSARPWEDVRVQNFIDEFLHVSRPGIGPAFEGDTRAWRWTEWGVMESPPSVLATGAPDHGSMSRYQYLFQGAPRLISRRHYSLREYLERRLRGEDGVDATKEETFGELIAGSKYLQSLANGAPDHPTPSQDLDLLLMMSSKWIHRAPVTDRHVVLVLLGGPREPHTARAAEDAEVKLERYGAAGLEVVALTTEAEAAVEAFARSEKLSYPIGLDPEGSALQYFHALAPPSALLFDQRGMQQGPAAAYDAVDLDARIRALLGAAAPDPFVGTWRGKTEIAGVAFEVEVVIAAGDGTWRLVQSAGKLVVAGTPRSGPLRNVAGALRIQDDTFEDNAEGHVHFFETWTFRAVGTDRLLLDVRTSRDAPKWDGPANHPYELRRVGLSGAPTQTGSKK